MLTFPNKIDNNTIISINQMEEKLMDEIIMIYGWYFR
jgi:hypothetical protein